MFTSEEIKREILHLQEKDDPTMPTPQKIVYDAAKQQTIAQLVLAYQLAELNSKLDYAITADGKFRVHVSS